MDEEDIITVINNDYFINRMLTNLFTNIEDEELEQALIESMEMQPTLEKTGEKVVLSDSVKYDSKTMKDSKCCICLSKYNKKSIVNILPNCGHIFHTKCIKEWGSYKKECPVCRKNI